MPITVLALPTRTWSLQRALSCARRRARSCALSLALSVVLVSGCTSTPRQAGSAALPGDASTAGGARTAQSRSSRDLIPAVVGIPNDAAVSETHRLVPGDVLDIEVFQVEELSTQERVNDSGFITLPLIGAVAVAGMTAEQAEQAIAAALAEDYLQDPQVHIFVDEFADQEVSVGGEVQSPGVFPLRGRTTLLQAIALAGGTTDFAKQSEIIVFRTTPDTDSINAYVVDLKKIQRGELGDPLLAGSDKIVVPKSGTRAFVRSVTDTLRGFVSVRAISF